MLDVNELSYAAIITIDLPGMTQPATISVTLTPPDLIETAPGQYKQLRDCTLRDLQAFAEAMEKELWATHQETSLADLAGEGTRQLKITVLDESGDVLTLDKEDILQHAIAVDGEVVDEEPVPAPAEDAMDEAADDSQDEPEDVEAEVAEEIEDVSEPDVETEDDLETETDVAAPAEEATPDVGEAYRTDEEPESDGGADEGEGVAPAPDEVDVPEVPEELRIAGLRRPPGHPTRAAVDILINEPAFREAQTHALSRLDREVAGILVGPQPEKQPDGRYVVHVTDVIVARHTRMQGASVTYTPESWRYVTDQLLERYPEEEAVIVGWYHTHPGFGIFLSGMDRFIHHNFFTQQWHVALVLDPLARRSGFFCWDRDQTEVQTYAFPWPSWAADTW